MDVREAVGLVVNYVTGFGGLMNTAGMRLEETELTADEEWLITLSFIDPQPQGLGVILQEKRSYKTFTVQRNGAVTSMKAKSPF